MVSLELLVFTHLDHQSTSLNILFKFYYSHIVIKSLQIFITVV